VLESGAPFQFTDHAVIDVPIKGTNKTKSLKKRENKQEFKQKRVTKEGEKSGRVQTRSGIDVSEAFKEVRVNGKRCKVFTNHYWELYGNLCVFSSSDKGITYQCSHCFKTVQAQGKLKHPLLMFD
jgi:hypothetical protein